MEMRKLKKYKPTKFKAKGSVYDKAAADYAVDFIQCLCHTKGTWAGKPFELIDWQEQIVRDVFGILKPDGYRQFNTAYVEIPKKQGKSELHHEVVRCGFAFGYDIGREVGQRHEGALQLLLHGGRFVLQTCRPLLEVGDEMFALFGLFAFALAHQGADLLGRFVLGGQRVVQFGLDGLAAVVQRKDFLDGGRCVDAFLGQLADGGLPIIADLLDCKHGSFVNLDLSDSDVQKYKTNREKSVFLSEMFRAA